MLKKAETLEILATYSANKGIKVVIAGANGYKEFSASASDITFAAADILSDTVTTSPSDVNVYIYFDGNDSNVFSDNIAQLTGEVSFTLKVFSADQNA